MVTTSDFSGLVSSAWALASAVAIAPIVSLDRCIAARRSVLDGEEVEADCSRLRALGPQPVPDRLLAVLGHEFFQFGLRIFVLKVGVPRAPENAGKLRPRI